MPLRLVFMGTPDFAVPTFNRIVESRHQIVGVYTRAPREGGRRGLELTSTPIDLQATEKNIPVFTPKSLRGDEAISIMRLLGADAAVVVAYGLILPRPILDIFPAGCFNVHASLLPRWRGAAPINRAIMAGDPETGVTIMKMDEGLDTGPIAVFLEKNHTPVAIAERTAIEQNATAGDLHDQLAQIGADLMLVALNALEAGSLRLAAQPEEFATYAQKIDKKETRINWHRPCGEVHNFCRGLSPFPGAWFEFPRVGRVKVLRTAIGNGRAAPGHLIDGKFTIGCGHGSLRLVDVQRAGGKPISGEAFLRGMRNVPVAVH